MLTDLVSSMFAAESGATFAIVGAASAPYVAQPQGSPEHRGALMKTTTMTKALAIAVFVLAYGLTLAPPSATSTEWTLGIGAADAQSSQQGMGVARMDRPRCRRKRGPTARSRNDRDYGPRCV
jgi:hypothetical protein